MKCSYHSIVESQAFCTACGKALCSECSNQIKGKIYCQDCLVRGAELAAQPKELRIRADSPKRAAVCALIPGMGAVYNNEYQKAIIFFAVFAALLVLGERVNGIFGFGAFVFLIFSMFDAYRTAEARARARMESGIAPEPLREDKAQLGWGTLLIVLGVLILLHSYIPYYFLNRSWPLVFILLGAYLVYRALRDRENQSRMSASISSEKKEL